MEPNKGGVAEASKGMRDLFGFGILQGERRNGVKNKPRLPIGKAAVACLWTSGNYLRRPRALMIAR